MVIAMKKRKRLLALLLASLLALCAACSENTAAPGGNESVTSEDSNAPPSESAGSDPSESGGEPSAASEQAGTPSPSQGTSSSVSQGGSWSPPETQTIPPAPVELNGLRFSSFGRYSGAFVEDGSDRAVENVACVLAVNTSDRYLELATVSFEIDGAAATFLITGLPPQAGAWVLEVNALPVESGASFVLTGGTTSFSDPETPPGVTALAQDGTVAVTNLSAETFSGYIYYKALHTDGYYLGGITYRSYVDSLPAQSSVEITAGHSTAGGSEIVRIMSASAPDG